MIRLLGGLCLGCLAWGFGCFDFGVGLLFKFVFCYYVVLDLCLLYDDCLGGVVTYLAFVFAC